MALIRTEAEMFPLVESWLHSGLTQKAFSLQQQLPPHILPYWASRYRKTKPAGEATATKAASGFIALSPPGPPAALTGQMEVVLPGGVILRFASLVPVPYLQEVLATCSP